MTQQIVKFQQQQDKPNQPGNNFLSQTLNGYYGQKNMSSLLQNPNQVKRINLKQYISNVDKTNPYRIISLDYDLDDYNIISNGQYFSIDIKHEKQIYFFNVDKEELIGKFAYYEQDKRDYQIFFTLDSKFVVLIQSWKIRIIPLTNESNFKVTVCIEGSDHVKLVTNEEKLIHYLGLKNNYQIYSPTILMINNGYFIGNSSSSISKLHSFKLNKKAFIMSFQSYLMFQIPTLPTSFIDKYQNANAYFGGRHLDCYFKCFGLVNLNLKKAKLYNLVSGKLIKKISINEITFEYKVINSKMFVLNNDLIIQLTLCDKSYVPKIRQKSLDIHCFKFQKKVCEKEFEQIETLKARSGIRGGIVEFYSF